MPLDVQNVLHARIKALLLGYAPLMALVKPGNVITADQVRATETDAAKTAAGDFPKIRIMVGEDATDERPMLAFCDDPAQVNRGIDMRLNVDIKIVHDTTSLLTHGPVEAAVRAALLSSGRTLGLTWVNTAAFRGVGQRKDEKSADTGDTLRTIARMRLVVAARPMRNLLIATT